MPVALLRPPLVYIVPISSRKQKTKKKLNLAMRLDLVLFALAAPLAALGDLRHSGRRTHSEIAKRAEGSVQLHKRFSSTRWTFYDVGGAAYVANVLLKRS